MGAAYPSPSYVTAPTSQPSGASRLRRWGWIGGGVLVASFLTWALVSGGSQVAEYDWNLDAAWVTFGVAVLGATYLLTALAYHRLLARLQPPAIAVVPALSMWGRSLLGRYVPGSVLMVVGRLEIGRGLGIARRVSFAASVYEQVFGLALAAIWGATYVLFGVGGAERGIGWLSLGLPLTLVGLHPRVFVPLSSWMLRKLGKSPLERHLSGADVARFAVWYAATATLMGVGIWACVHAAAPGSGSVFELVGAFQLSVVIATLAVLVPSGLGVREGIFAIALARHLPNSVALVISVGTRFVLTLVELAFVAFVVVLARCK